MNSMSYGPHGRMGAWMHRLHGLHGLYELYGQVTHHEGRQILPARSIHCPLSAGSHDHPSLSYTDARHALR